MKPLFESILRPEQDIEHAVEIKSILRKYYWTVKDAYWKGNTLRVVFDGRGYMDDFDKVAEELNCKSFSVYPWAIIKSDTPLEGFSIDAETRLDITAPEIRGCKLQANQQRVKITNPDGVKKVKVVNCDFITNHLCFNKMDGVTLSGNNFRDVKVLTLTHVGPKIEKIVLGWNLVTNAKGGWRTYPAPPGKPDPNMNPFKDLGLDKHFKNLTDLNIASELGADDMYITFSDNYKRGPHDWGVFAQVNLTSGWQCNVIKDARCV